MNKEFIPFELAVKLKEKGYKQGYNAFGYRPIFSDENTIKFISDIGAYENEYLGINIPCPEISQVLKWLREQKGMEVYPNYNRVYKHWTYIARAFDDSCYNSVGGFKSYEQAALAGIEYVLDNLI